MKYDTSLFLFGSNSKKHKNSLVMGRMYDCHVLDMVELQIENFVKSAAFDVSFVIEIWNRSILYLRVLLDWGFGEVWYNSNEVFESRRLYSNCYSVNTRI